VVYHNTQLVTNTMHMNMLPTTPILDEQQQQQQWEEASYKKRAWRMTRE
jgi:hypothetical protein